VLHEHVQRDIFCEVVARLHSRIVRGQRRWVHSSFDLALLCVTRLCDEEARHGETRLHDVLSVLHRVLEQILDVLVLWILVILLFLPLSNSRALPDADVEESVHQEDHFVLHRVNIQQHWVSFSSLQVVLHQGRLNHNERI